LFVPACTDASRVEQRILEQSARLGHYGAISGWAALRWRGASYFNGTWRGEVLPVPLAVGKGCLRPDPAFVRLRRQLPLWEWDLCHGVRCALWPRALFDEIQRLGNARSGAVALDMVVAAELGTIVEFWDFLEHVRPRNGVVLARECAALARGRYWSPQEAWMGQAWCLDAGLPEPLFNVPVFDRHGNLVGIPDLLDPVAGVVGEYQGGVHRDPEQHRRDVERAERFRAVALEYFEVVAGQLQDPRTATRMRDVRARAKFLSPQERAWTLDQPTWWRERETRRLVS
jgi:hypothetical protein